MERKRKIYIDLTDLLNNIIWNNSFSGIQRVQLGIASGLTVSLSAIPYSVFEGKWIDLTQLITEVGEDATLLMQRIRSQNRELIEKKERAFTHPLSTFKLRLERRVRRFWTDRQMAKSLMENTKPQDIIFSLGAFWQVPGLIKSYKAAYAAQRSVIGMCHDIFSILTHEGPVSGYKRSIYQSYVAACSRIITVSMYTAYQIRKAEEMGLFRKSIPPLDTIQLPHEFPDTDRNHEEPLSKNMLDAIGGNIYALYVSRYEDRKNHLRLMDVWRDLSQAHDDLPILVMAGRSDGLDKSLLEDKIVWIDKPSDQEIIELYANCAFSIFPSLEEGWGLPVGEALWFGKATTASDTSSIPEVGGNAVLYFNPTDKSDIAKSISSFLCEDTRTRYSRYATLMPLRSWSDYIIDIKEYILAI